MNRNLLFALLLLALGASAQERRVEGYLLTNYFDTLRCRIVLPAGFTFAESDPGFLYEVAVLDADSVRHYTPYHLMGFGFRERMQEAHYRTELFSDEQPRAFYRALHIGPRFSLFYVPHTIADGSARPMPVRAAAGDTRASYCISDAHGRLLFLESTLDRAALQQALRDYFKDDPALLALVPSVRAFADIDAFVAKANEAR